MNKFCSVKDHYDLLITENNDPVYDPPQLKSYMDQYDGEKFIDLLRISKADDVLEIGVGTGRLALRVADRCKTFTGIDISPKTIERAYFNLKSFSNVNLICADFLQYDFHEKYNLIYSSLTFMHFSDKYSAIRKIYNLLTSSGRFVLSTDKNPREILDFGNRMLRVFPDDRTETENTLQLCGFTLSTVHETKSAFLFSATKTHE